MWNELKKMAQPINKQPWEMTKDEFDRTGLQVGSNLKERFNRVMGADDDYRLPNLKHHMPKDRLTPIMINTPDMVTIYRGASCEYDDIQPGNWVALKHEYAKQHTVGRAKGHVISKQVSASDVVWAGTDENEFFYAPKSYQVSYASTTHRALIDYALKNGFNIPEEVLKDYPDLVNKNVE